MADASHYRTLNLPREADADAIKARFRELALRHHPDQNAGNPEAEARFLLILEAWKVLGNPEAKARYDRYLAERPTTSRPVRVQRRDTASEVRDSLNSLLWDVEDLLREARPLAQQKDLMRILTFFDRWLLEPVGLVDYFMEARGLGRLNPESYLDQLFQTPGRLTHFPFTTVHNYYFDIRKRMNRYFDRLGTLRWLEPLPGKTVRFIDAVVEAQNLALHYLSGIRSAGHDTAVPRYQPSHPDFQ